MRISKIRVQRFRSINDLTVNVYDDKPFVVCGANNVGKTNFLRALNLFFSTPKVELFNTDRDIPFEIQEGSRSNYNTKITVDFFDQKKKTRTRITTVFKRISKTMINQVTVSGRQGKNILSKEEAVKVIKSFKFLFIEASNINIPYIIDQIIDEEVLPFLDPLRKTQINSLNKFKDFLNTAEEVLSKTTKQIKIILDQFVTDIPGIDSKDWEVKILFSEYAKLRQALSGIVDFTLYDKNQKEIESKGSGIQRVVLLTLMKYISEKSKKKIIWAIDEPEAFLQPSLQKRTSEIIRNISKDQQVFLATHSNNFVDTGNMENTSLFEAKYSLKRYVRKPDKAFYQMDTFVDNRLSKYEKTLRIKQHFGIERNDSWVILPYNLMVEGEEDKRYLETFMKKLGCPIPNIFVAGGVNKISGYLSFLHEFCDDPNFKPEIRIIVDHDAEGKKEYCRIKDKIQKNKYNRLQLSIEHIKRCDNKIDNSLDFEIEDFVYPEVIIENINKLLKKKGYKTLKRKEVSKERFEPAYDNKCMLSLINERVASLNTDKERLDFQNDGWKRWVCESSCKYISGKDINKLIARYPEVEQYIKSLCKC